MSGDLTKLSPNWKWFVIHPAIFLGAQDVSLQRKEPSRMLLNKLSGLSMIPSKRKSCSSGAFTRTEKIPIDGGRLGRLPSQVAMSCPRRSAARSSDSLGVLACAVDAVDDRVRSVTVEMGVPRLTRGELPMAGPAAERAVRVPLRAGDRTWNVVRFMYRAHRRGRSRSELEKPRPVTGSMSVWTVHPSRSRPGSANEI